VEKSVNKTGCVTVGEVVLTDEADGGMDSEVDDAGVDSGVGTDASDEFFVGSGDIGLKDGDLLGVGVVEVTVGAVWNTRGEELRAVSVRN
jgi:hypothetical protein